MIFNNVPNTESFSECIPTNGDMIKAIFPEVDVTYNGFLVEVELEAFGFTVEESWWNAPYKGSEE